MKSILRKLEKRFADWVFSLVRERLAHENAKAISTAAVMPEMLEDEVFIGTGHSFVSLARTILGQEAGPRSRYR